MDDSLLQIYFRKDDKSNFSLYSHPSSFKSGGHSPNTTINDVAWAPLAGRSYHLIASCGKDGLIVVWKVTVRDIFNGDAGIYREPIVESMSKLEPTQ